MSYGILPNGKQQFIDSNGNPLAGGKVYYYIPSTTTPKNTYQDDAGSILNTNPVVLDASGQCIVYGTGSYRQQVFDVNNNLIWDQQVDTPLTSSNQTYDIQEQTFTATAGQTVFVLTNFSYAPGANNLTVFVNGLKQIVNTNYLETSSTVITFTTGLNVGAIVDLTAAVLQTSASVISAATVLYQYPASGAVSESVQTRLQQFVSVKDFGATGDGTTDDTVAIQNAINTGLNVVAPSGYTFKTTSTLTISTTSQVINFNGSSINPNGTFNALTLTASNGGVQNLVINGTNLTGIGFYAPAAVQSFYIQNVVVKNCTTGISMTNIYTCWLQNVSVFNCSSVPAIFKSNISGTPINSIWFQNCDFSANTTTGNVLEIDGAAGVFVDSCTFQNNTGSGCNDIALVANTYDGFTKIVVQNSYFEDGVSLTGNVISLGYPSSTNNLSGCVIQNNYFQTSKTPIYVANSTVSNDLLVTGNTFIAITGSPSYAMNVYASSYVPNVYSNSGSQAAINSTFTPSITFGGGSTGITYTIQLGRYTRIGNRIFGEIHIVLSNKGSSTGSAAIIGLPIAASASSYLNMASVTNYSSMASLTSQISGGIGASNAGIGLFNFSATASSPLAETNFTNTSSLYVWFSYEI